MKLHSDLTIGANTITAYGPDHVAVNGRRYAGSVLLDRQWLEPGWPVASNAALTAEALAPLLARHCDVILLGTGVRQRFPAASLLRPLIEARKAVEVMDTVAACRTFNILVAEGRNPLAALIVEAMP